MLELDMPVTKNSFKKYNEITPVYVSIEIHVYTCYHYLKATKCGKYKINTGYGMLHTAIVYFVIMWAIHQ
jgi:hypothetical protein